MGGRNGKPMALMALVRRPTYEIALLSGTDSDLHEETEGTEGTEGTEEGILVKS